MSFSPLSAQEFVERITISNNSRNRLRDFVQLKTDELPMSEVIDPVQKALASGCIAILLSLESPEEQDFFSFSELSQLNPKLGEKYGTLLVQNEQGDKVISVYDRDRHGSMWQGARYHQTREGGSIHTDNVNVPEVWEYLFLSCISPALVGGESILVNGRYIHSILKREYPDALKILESDFIWEMRGVADELYHAPIITYDKNGEPLFRHLRPYMESAHIKAETPLTPAQMYAVDVLDALTNSSSNQIRYRMKKGDILITKDAQVLHGRTCFSDAYDAVAMSDFSDGKVLKRTMERLWIKQ